MAEFKRAEFVAVSEASRALSLTYLRLSLIKSLIFLSFLQRRA